MSWHAATSAAIEKALALGGRPIYEHSILAFDLETTGPDPAGDLIVQIGTREILPGRGLGEGRDWLVYPGVPVPAETAKFHGIDDARLQAAPLFLELASELAPRFACYDFIAGYNALTFDVPILQRELLDAGFGPDLPFCFDPMPFVRWWWAGMHRCNLSRVCARMGVRLTKAHDALADVTATAELFVRMVDRGLIPSGVDAAMEVQRLCFEHREAEFARWGGRFFERGAEVYMGFGKWCGRRVADTPRDYLRMLLSKNPQPDPAGRWPEAALRILAGFA